MTEQDTILQLQKRRTREHLVRENVRLARLIRGVIPPRLIDTLKSLSQELDLSLRKGDLQLLENSWYVTHTGLLRLARRRRCKGIHVEPADSLCDSTVNRFVMKATVYPSKGSAGFVGYGDADPSNVSVLVRGAEMRIAETRAVNRALRKAYGIGICSVEELGTAPISPVAPHSPKMPPSPTNHNAVSNAPANGNGPKVRDRLCQIIRQHKLDPELVKAYALDYCRTAELKGARPMLLLACSSSLPRRNNKSPRTRRMKSKSGYGSTMESLPPSGKIVEFHERLDEGASNLFEYFVQAGVAFRPRPWLTLIPIYRYQRFPGNPAITYENRLQFNITLSKSRGPWRYNLRTLVEGRFPDDRPASARLRFRPGLDYTLPLRTTWRPTVVVSNEFFCRGSTLSPTVAALTRRTAFRSESGCPSPSHFPSGLTTCCSP